MKNTTLLPLVGILGLTNVAKAGELNVEPEIYAATMSTASGEDMQATYTDDCGQFTRARVTGPVVSEGSVEDLNLYYGSPNIGGVKLHLLGDRSFDTGLTKGNAFFEWSRDGEKLDSDVRAGSLFTVNGETDFGAFAGGRLRTNYLTAELDAYNMQGDLGLGARGFVAGLVTIDDEGRQIYLSAGGKTLEKQLVSTAALMHPEGKGLGLYNKIVFDLSEEGEVSSSGQFAISNGTFTRKTLDTRSRIYNGNQMVGAHTSVSGRWGYAPFNTLGDFTLAVDWNSDLEGSIIAYQKIPGTPTFVNGGVVREGTDVGLDMGVYVVVPLSEDLSLEGWADVVQFRDAGLQPVGGYLAINAKF